MIPAVVQSATADAVYPPANLYDGCTAPPCKWASLGADYYLDLVLNLVPDGDAEQAVVPAAWVVVNGTLARSTAVAAYKGSYEFALTPTGIGDAYATLDLMVSAGAYLQLRGATRGNTRTARIMVTDLERGNLAYYLAADGTWTTTPTWLGSTSASAWTATTVTELRIPTFAEWGRTSGKIRVMLWNAGDGASTAAVYFDEILLYPSKLDVVALVGHNFPKLSRLRLQTFADYWWGGATTTLWDDATGVFLQPTAFRLDTTTIVTTPYLRVMVSLPAGGTAYRLPQIGELFLGRTVALPRTVRPGWQTEWADEQPRQRTRGALWAQREAVYPGRKLPLDLDLDATASPDLWDTVLTDILQATNMGSTPCLLLPATTAEPSWCMFGNFDDSFRLTRGETTRQWSGKFEELGIPIG
jgi:hypothetical protein